MNCSICLEQIEPFFDAKISSCSWLKENAYFVIIERSQL